VVTESRALGRPVVKMLRAAILAATALFGALLFGPASGRAAPRGEIAAICDTGIAPYRVLLESLKKSCDCELRVIPPEEAAREGLERRLKADGVRAVLAVGLRAREAVEGLRDLPVLLTMVPNVAPWVAARSNRAGIEMSLSPRQHLEALRRVFPRARRIGVIFDPAQTGGYVRDAQTAAAALQLTLETREIGRAGELSRHLEELRGRVDALWLIPDPTVLQGENLSLLLLYSFESRVPLYGFARKYVEQGAVAASQADIATLGVQVADVIRSMSLLPASAGPRWEYSRGAQLLLNQKVARKMGIVFDPAVLEAAADVLR